MPFPILLSRRGGNERGEKGGVKYMIYGYMKCELFGVLWVCLGCPEGFPDRLRSPEGEKEGLETG